MKLAQVIALYVAFRKNLGVSFENDAKLLQCFLAPSERHWTSQACKRIE